MPTGLVVKCLGTLLPVLTRIINLSLASGKFAEEWKEALVVPLLKHQGLNLEFCNLRPISNLQYVSKLTERAVFEQMNNHMMQFGTLSCFTISISQGTQHGDHSPQDTERHSSQYG